MSDFYDEMAAVALELLTEFGSDVTLYRETGATANPVTGAVVAGTDASVVSKGLLKPYPNSMIDGTRILVGDRMLVLSAENTPLPTDKPVIAGQKWAIVNITSINPAGTPLVHFVQVRK